MIVQRIGQTGHIARRAESKRGAIAVRVGCPYPPADFIIVEHSGVVKRWRCRCDGDGVRGRESLPCTAPPTVACACVRGRFRRNAISASTVLCAWVNPAVWCRKPRRRSNVPWSAITHLPTTNSRNHPPSALWLVLSPSHEAVFRICWASRSISFTRTKAVGTEMCGFNRWMQWARARRSHRVRPYAVG